MKLLLHSLNYSPELTGIGKYNGEMCVELVKRNVTVETIVAPPYYPEWRVHKGYKKYLFHNACELSVNITRCPLYVPQHVTTLKRLVHLASFAISSAIALLAKSFHKPDVIMLVQPTLFCAPFTLIYAKLTGAKSIMHIQDYELDAMFGLGFFGMSNAKHNSIAKFAINIEKWLTSKFDAVSTISYSMVEKAKEKGVDAKKIIYFPNWSDTEFVTPNTCGLDLKREWGFDSHDRIVLYAGNIGKKQGLDLVLEVAKHYLEDHHIKFVFVGDGAHAETLKNQACLMKLTNIYFKPLQPWELVPQMLALADIHLVVQNKGAADAVLPSKLTNILSVGGHALVTAESHTELGKIAKNHQGIFTIVEPENPKALLAGLDCLLAKDTTKHNEVAREFAVRFLAKDKILNQFLDDLNALIKG